MTFKQLGIIEPILKALLDKGYESPSPIQEQSIPILLNKKDLLGCAQTGTGKTAAFAIPIVQHIHNDFGESKGPKKIRALVVTPTRELAIQIADNFVEYSKYTGLKTTVIFGGVKQGKQVDRIKRGIDVLVATPGRLLDLINQGFVSLDDVRYVVLDEADHMLDMGFIHDVKKIVKLLPEKRQSLLFSATMPKDIVELSEKMLGSFERVTIKPQQATAERVEQAVYMVTKKDKDALLQHILSEKGKVSTLVFSRTKHGANKIVKTLNKSGFQAEAIHGNKSQVARQKALKDFKDGRIHILVATDIAARGIDVDDLALVVNYDLPNIPETYVHRIGRTGRAAASGIALSFCNGEERAFLRDIQKLIGQAVPLISDHPFVDDSPEPSGKKTKSKSGKKDRSDDAPRNKERSNDRNKPHGKKSEQRKPDHKKRPQTDRPAKSERSAESTDRKPQRVKSADRPASNDRKESSDARPARDSNRSANRPPKKSNHSPANKEARPDAKQRPERNNSDRPKKSNTSPSGRYRPKNTKWELD